MFIKASAIKHENVQHTVSLSLSHLTYTFTHMRKKNDKDEAKSIQQNNKYTTNKIQEDYYSLQPSTSIDSVLHCQQLHRKTTPLRVLQTFPYKHIRNSCIKIVLQFSSPLYRFFFLFCVAILHLKINVPSPFR